MRLLYFTCLRSLVFRVSSSLYLGLVVAFLGLEDHSQNSK